MDKKQEEAISKLKSLQAEFEAVAADARETKFFHSFIYNGTVVEKQYTFFADEARVIGAMLTQEDTEAAATTLTDLMEVFNYNATYYKGASKKPASDQPDEEQKAGERFSAQAQKVAEILKLLKP